MPFMLIHPAAALPLYRRLGRYGVLSALIIGSLTPDMHYFLPLAVSRDAAHSVSGLVWFCWPVGIALYLLYHLLLKQPLALLLPRAIATRVAPWLRPGHLPEASWRAVLLSLLAGAMTHIAWDAFTHRHGPVVAALPVLRSVWFTLENYPLAGYAVLQQASNVVGFAVLATWSWRCLRSLPSQPIASILSVGQRALILSGVLIASAGFAAISIHGAAAMPTESRVLHNTFKQAALAAMSSTALALLAYCLLWHIRSKLRRISPVNNEKTS